MINRTYFTETYYDMEVGIAQRFAHAIREAWLTGKDFEGEKKKGFFLSLKGSKSMRGGFEDKLYVGNIHRIENHLYWNDEELADDDEIVNVVVIDGPVTRDGDGCSYGSKDHRDQIMYANTIPQVKGHIFIINTPGGAASARIDYEQAIADCREKGKSTVAWVDGLCASAGQLVAALCDRTIVMNGRDTMGCIGTMCAFWAVPHDNVDQDGYRYIELVSVTSPDKNVEYREAAEGKYAKLQSELDKLGKEFRETVRQNRPLVKDEHLTGKTFDADSVMGALVDEIGNYGRAIEAVFELANGTLTSAREATVIFDGETAGGETEKEQAGSETPAEGQSDYATLNEQQKAAIATNPGAMVKVDDGHVSTSVQTLFGPEEVEIAKPQNNKDMTEEEKKAAEVVEQPAATQEEQTPATETTETPETTENPEGTETPEEPESPETAGQAEALAAAEALVAERDKEIAELKESLAALEGIAEERDKTAKELATAESNIAENGKTIEALNGDMEGLRKDVAEKDALIEKLTAQVADLKAEVKELSEEPTPMVNAESGVPVGNGIGEAPQQKPRIKSGMTYEEIRAIEKNK